jgi:ribosomal protein S18 acetylase RimI-like enzyme
LTDGIEIEAMRPNSRDSVVVDEITTRAFAETDYDAVIELWHRCDGVEVAEGDDRKTITLYLRRNPGLSRVAVCRGRIVGAVLCGHDGRRGLIYHLAVAAEVRGRGLGRILVQECVAGLRASGIPRALIMVEKGNVSGQRFWAAQGFEEISGAAAFGADIPG